MTPEESTELYREAHGKSPLSKEDVYRILDEHEIKFERVEHPAVFTVDQADQVLLPFEAHMAKNLFLRDDKKRNYYLVTVPEHKNVDLHRLQSLLHSRRLSFASPGDLACMLGVWPGAVTPFCALNDDERRVLIVLDADFVRMGWIGCHPCDNTASIHLATSKLLSLIRKHESSLLLMDTGGETSEPEADARITAHQTAVPAPHVGPQRITAHQPER